MSWDDLEEEDFYEILKLDLPIEHEEVMHEDVFTAYIEPFWKTFEAFTNLWDKKRHRIQCKKIKKYPSGMKQDDFIGETIYFLDMGKRLLKAMKDFGVKKIPPKYVKITRIGLKFDIQYYVKIYKLIKQTKITSKKITSRIEL